MTHSQARELLRICRPGTPDEHDAEVRTAMAMAQSDGELQAWMEDQQRFHRNLRQSLRGIQPPADLKAKILEGNAARKIVWWKWRELLLMAACLALLGCVLAMWIAPGGKDDAFEKFHARMAKTALREYRMSMMASEWPRIQAYLADHGHPARFELPEKLAGLAGAGCALLRWNDSPVSLVCLRQPNQELLWLFVAKAETFKKHLPPGSPEFRQTGRLATAVWARQDMVFILGGIGSRSLVERYL